MSTRTTTTNKAIQYFPSLVSFLDAYSDFLDIEFDSLLVPSTQRSPYVKIARFSYSGKKLQTASDNLGLNLLKLLASLYIDQAIVPRAFLYLYIKP